MSRIGEKLRYSIGRYRRYRPVMYLRYISKVTSPNPACEATFAGCGHPVTDCRPKMGFL